MKKENNQNLVENKANFKAKGFFFRHKSLWKNIKFVKNKSLTGIKYRDLTSIRNYKNDQDPIVNIVNLSQVYRKIKSEKVIYKNINLKIYPGETVAILGPNGAGKTTLAETIAGTKKQTDGKIEYSFPYVTSPLEKIGMQFQDLKFPHTLTVKDIIAFVLDLNSIKEFEIPWFNEFLDTFHLTEHLCTRAAKLSGGQQQRLNVFLSLIRKPKILILDEYTNGLDIAVKNSIQSLIKKYIVENDITLILISHDVDAISYLAKRIVILAEGEIKIDMDREEIDKQFGNLSNLLNQYIIY